MGEIVDRKRGEGGKCRNLNETDRKKFGELAEGTRSESLGKLTTFVDTCP
jgi:hypothetical protein